MSTASGSSSGGPGGPAAVPFPVVGLAASAGGMQALFAVLGGLPASFPAAVLVVQHLAPHHRSVLAELFGRKSALTVSEARDGDPVRAGHVSVAPPDHHLLLNADFTISLSRAPLVHFLRPSADLLFESIAASAGEHAVAVVLTGTGTDGTMGIRAIKEKGGAVIAQDEVTSEFFGMPSSAIATGLVDAVLPLPQIAPALVSLVALRDLA